MVSDVYSNLRLPITHQLSIPNHTGDSSLFLSLRTPILQSFLRNTPDRDPYDAQQKEPLFCNPSISNPSCLKAALVNLNPVSSGGTAVYQVNHPSRLYLFPAHPTDKTVSLTDKSFAHSPGQPIIMSPLQVFRPRCGVTVTNPAKRDML